MSERLTREQIRTWRQYGYRLERLADTALSLMDENERLLEALMVAEEEAATPHADMLEFYEEGLIAALDATRDALADTEEGLT